MSDTMILAPVAGWYDDPINDATWRWWDGANWTNQARSKDIPLVSMVPTHAPPKYFDEQRGDGALVAQSVSVPPTPAEPAPTMFLEPELEPELEPADVGEPELIVYEDEPVDEAPAAPSEYALPEYTAEPAYVAEPAFVAQSGAYDLDAPVDPAPVDLAPAYDLAAATTVEAAADPYVPATPYVQASPYEQAASAPQYLPTQQTAGPQRFGQLFADDPVVSVVVTPESGSTSSSSTDLEMSGREPGAPVYPWDAAIAALAADNARFEAANSASAGVVTQAAPVAPAMPSRRTLRSTSSPSAPAAATTTPAAAPSTSTTVAVIPRGPAAAPATGAPESANTIWIWLLAFSFYIWGIVGGIANFAALTVVGTGTVAADPSALGLVGLVTVVAGLVPLWVFAGLDRRALAARGLEGPSILWMLLLPPIGYFVARGRKLAAQNARSRGPRIALTVVTVIQVAAFALGTFVAVTMLSSLLSMTGVTLPF